MFSWAIESGCNTAYTFFYMTNDTELNSYQNSIIFDWYTNVDSNVNTLSNHFGIEIDDNHHSIVETSATDPVGTQIYTTVYSYYYDNPPDTYATNKLDMPMTIYIWPNCSIESVSIIDTKANEAHTVY